jgi:hypothetical protein
MNIGPQYLNLFRNLSSYAAQVNNDPAIDTEPHQQRVVVDGFSKTGESFQLDGWFSEQGRMKDLNLQRGQTFVSMHDSGPYLEVLEQSGDRLKTFVVDKEDGNLSAQAATTVPSQPFASDTTASHPWLNQQFDALDYIVAGTPG